MADETQGKFKQSLRAELHSDMKTFLLPAELRFEDRTSMAFSIESRVPFLDYRLVEFIHSLPAHYLLNNGWSKWILRQSMASILPDAICWRRDKMGFQTPEAMWLKAANIYIRDLFSSSNLNSTDYLEPKHILNKLDSQFEMQGTGDNVLWRWINLELWMQRFDMR